MIALWVLSAEHHWQVLPEMAAIDDDRLREMARHRGLKLVKSRRRKPGVGDYGKYGLTDAAGKALLGMDDDGFTASADDIQDYLRTSAIGTWKQSAETTPDRPPPPKRPRLPEPKDEDAPVRRRSKRAPADRSAPHAREEPTAVRRKTAPDTRAKPALKLVSRVETEPQPEPEPRPEPVLRIRATTAADADALSTLLGQLRGMSIDGAEVADNLAMVRKAEAGMIVAELDGIIGCCGWAVVPTVHRGAIGRLTMLVVDKAHRRGGVGTAMLAAAEKALAKAGCCQVEAMSDIRIDNAHNFFRSLNFEQTSYRFVRSIDQ